jgi:DNA-binding NtrC family response regulator
MAARRRSPAKRKRSTPPAKRTIGVAPPLKLIPNTATHETTSALAVSNALSMARAIMEDQLGADPAITKDPQHVDFTFRLLQFILEDARIRRGQRTPTSSTATQRGPRSSQATADVLSPRDHRRRAELVALLGEHRGNVSEVARVMGKGRTQIRRWIKKFELDTDSFRDA